MCGSGLSSRVARFATKPAQMIFKTCPITAKNIPIAFRGVQLYKPWSGVMCVVALTRRLKYNSHQQCKSIQIQREIVRLGNTAEHAEGEGRRTAADVTGLALAMCSCLTWTREREGAGAGAGEGGRGRERARELVDESSVQVGGPHSLACAYCVFITIAGLSFIAFQIMLTRVYHSLTGHLSAHTIILIVMAAVCKWNDGAWPWRFYVSCIYVSLNVLIWAKWYAL